MIQIMHAVQKRTVLDIIFFASVILFLLSSLFLFLSVRYHRQVDTAQNKYEAVKNELEYYKELHRNSNGYNVDPDTVWLKYHQ